MRRRLAAVVVSLATATLLAGCSSNDTKNTGGTSSSTAGGTAPAAMDTTAKPAAKDDGSEPSNSTRMLYTLHSAPEPLATAASTKPSQAWQVGLPAGSNAFVVDGTPVATTTGRFTWYDPKTGTQAGSVGIPGTLYTPRGTSTGGVYIAVASDANASAPGPLVGIDLKTGTVWKTEQTYSVNDLVGATPDVVVLAGDQGVTGLDVRTGTQKWKNETARDALVGTTVTAVGDAGGKKINFLATADGTALGSMDVGEFDDAIVVGTAFVVVEGTGSKLAAYDTSTGKQLWSVPTNGNSGEKPKLDHAGNVILVHYTDSKRISGFAVADGHPTFVTSGDPTSTARETEQTGIVVTTDAGTGQTVDAANGTVIETLGNAGSGSGSWFWPVTGGAYLVQGSGSAVEVSYGTGPGGWFLTLDHPGDGRTATSGVAPIDGGFVSFDRTDMKLYGYLG